MFLIKFVNFDYFGGFDTVCSKESYVLERNSLFVVIDSHSIVTNKNIIMSFWRSTDHTISKSDAIADLRDTASPSGVLVSDVPFKHCKKHCIPSLFGSSRYDKRKR